MKLVRYGRAGAERPGLIDADGKLRDLSRVVKDITPDVLTPSGLRRLRGVKTARLPLVKGRSRLGCPMVGIGKIVCIGLNYTDHAQEVNLALPKEPTIFIKANSAITGPNDPTVRPYGAVKLDYEVELVAVIGRDARRVDEARALEPRRRVLPHERRLRARLPDGARRRHDQGQERGHVRAHRPLHRDGRRGGRPSGAPPLDHRQRRAPPERPHEGHGLPRPGARRVREPLHVAPGRRSRSRPALRPGSGTAPSHRAIWRRATSWRWESTVSARSATSWSTRKADGGHEPSGVRPERGRLMRFRARSR